MTTSTPLPETIKLLSFDPGLTCAGWAMSEFHISTGEFKIIRYGSIYSIKLASVAAQKPLVAIYGKRQVALKILEEHIRRLVSTQKPNFIVSEDAFCNPRLINAYGALLQWLTTTENMLYSEFDKPLYRLAPKHIKRLVAGIGTADKVNIQKAIMDNPQITFKSNIDSIILNEHEGDAIGVGYAFTMSMLPGILGTEYFSPLGITEVVKPNKKKK